MLKPGDSRTQLLRPVDGKSQSQGKSQGKSQGRSQGKSQGRSQR